MSNVIAMAPDQRFGLDTDIGVVKPSDRVQKQAAGIVCPDLLMDGRADADRNPFLPILHEKEWGRRSRPAKGRDQ